MDTGLTFAVIVGWVGTVVALSFLFGKRLQHLEDQDATLTKNVESLSQTVKALADHVNGQHGNASLSRAIEALTASTTAANGRLTSLETAIQLHEVRLARMDEMRSTIEERWKDFYDRKWDPLLSRINAMANDQATAATSAARIEAVLTERSERQPKRRGET